MSKPGSQSTDCQHKWGMWVPVYNWPWSQHNIKARRYCERCDKMEVQER